MAWTKIVFDSSSFKNGTSVYSITKRISFHFGISGAFSIILNNVFNLMVSFPKPTVHREIKYI